MVKIVYQPIDLSFWNTKYIKDMVNVHKYDSYIIPQRWYVYERVVKQFDQI